MFTAIRAPNFSAAVARARVAEFALDPNASRLRVRCEVGVEAPRASLPQHNRDQKSLALRSTQSFFRQILLAALLKLCNAAENFCAMSWNILRNSAGSRGKGRLFCVARCAG
jgi:hypothetical protein